MKLAIIGSRTFDDEYLLDSTLRRYWGPDQVEGGSDEGPYIDEIVSGGAKGADQLGAQWAKKNDVKLIEFIPDWDKYVKRAGFLRNEDIIKASTFVLAFWSGVSKGTGHSLSIAKRLKKPTLIVYF